MPNQHFLSLFPFRRGRSVDVDSVSSRAKEKDPAVISALINGFPGEMGRVALTLLGVISAERVEKGGRPKRILYDAKRCFSLLFLEEKMIMRGG